jgi:hypothetical protein
MPSNQDYITLDPLAADPTAPPEGSVWWNTTTEQLMIQTATGSKVLAQLGGPGAGGMVQSKFVEVAADVSTTSTTWVDLLSTTITTLAGFLLLTTTVSPNTSSTSAGFYIRLLLDGVAVRGASGYAGSATFNETVSIVSKEAVTAGLHTVKVQWRVSTGTLRCRPVTAPDQDHASLLIQEVNV